MPAKTFTVLVTIEDDTPPTTLFLEEQIQQALEEGTREHRGFTCALVSAAVGDRVDTPLAGGLRINEMSRLYNRKRLHADMLADAN